MEEREVEEEPEARHRVEEAQEIFLRPYDQDQRSDLPEQYRSIGWVGQKLYSLIRVSRG